MLASTYDMLASREDVYWWHVARRQLAATLLEKHGLPEHCRAVDLGCGTGGNLALFSAFKPRLTGGIDLSEQAISYSRRRHAAELVRTDLAQPLPFMTASFDVCTIFNVLYHNWIPDERAALSEAYRILRPGGLLLITEPAFSALARKMDRIALGGRRYAPRAFVGLCRSSGFQVLQHSCMTSFGVPAILGIRALEYLSSFHAGHGNGKGSADMKALRPGLNRFLLAAARAENQLIARGIRIPIGVTLIFVCRKPG